MEEVTMEEVTMADAYEKLLIKHPGELLVPEHAFVNDEYVAGHSSAFYVDGVKVHGEVALQYNLHKTLQAAGEHEQAAVALSIAKKVHGQALRNRVKVAPWRAIREGYWDPPVTVQLDPEIPIYANKVRVSKEKGNYDSLPFPAIQQIYQIAYKYVNHCIDDEVPVSAPMVKTDALGHYSVPDPVANRLFILTRRPADKQTQPATPMPTPGLPPRSTPASKPSTKKNPSQMPSTPASKRSAKSTPKRTPAKSTPKRTPARLASPMAAASPSLTPSQRLKTARLLEESAERRMQEMTAIRESREQNASAKKLQHEKVLLQNQAVLGQNKEVLGQNKQVIGQNRRILDSNQEDNRELGQALDQENEASEMLYELRNERILQEVAEEDEEEEEEEEDDQPMLPSTRPVHRKLDFNEVVNESSNKPSTDSSAELEDNESQVDNEKDNASKEDNASEEAIVDTKSDAKLEEEVVPPSPGLLRRGIQGGIQGASDLLTYMSPFGKAAPAKTKTILHYEPLVEEAEEASANADSDSDSDNEDDDDNAEGPTEAEGTTERDTLKAESEDDNHSEDAAVDTLKAESEEEVESEDDNDLDADLEDAELEDEAAAAVDTLKAESEDDAESEDEVMSVKAESEDEALVVDNTLKAESEEEAKSEEVAATKKTKMTAAEKAAARKRAYDSVIGNGKAAAKDDQSNKKKAKKDDKPPKKNDKRPKCKGFFANGNPCTRYVMEGSEYCGLHAAK